MSELLFPSVIITQQPKSTDEGTSVQNTASAVPIAPIPSPTLIEKETNTPSEVTVWTTVPATSPTTTATFSDPRFTQDANGSTMILAIVISIIGGALFLTLAGWMWHRTRRNDKSFEDNGHDTELGKHGLFNNSGAPGGASRHYSVAFTRTDGSSR